MATAVFKTGLDGHRRSEKRPRCPQPWTDTYQPAKRARLGHLDIASEPEYFMESRNVKATPMDWSMASNENVSPKSSKPSPSSDYKQITTVSTWLAPR